MTKETEDQIMDDIETQPARPYSPLADSPCWTKSQLILLPVLSIRQPWAWLILHGGKDIENRNWPTRFRGTFLIHAGKGMTRLEYEQALDVADDCGKSLPPFETLQRGGIVGQAKIVDCVSRSDSPWFFGEFGFVLKDAQPLEFFACKGALGFFNLSNTEVSGALPPSVWPTHRTTKTKLSPKQQAWLDNL